MEMLITTVEGYTIVYEPRDKIFYLKDGDGEVVGQGKTQEEVEDQAKKLSKSGFKPIAALKRQELALEVGRVTSINMADKSVRFSFDDPKGTLKVRLGYGPSLYELTDHNHSIKKQVDGFLADIGKIEERIRGLMQELDKQINLEYFNLEIRR